MLLFFYLHYNIKCYVNGVYYLRQFRVTNEIKIKQRVFAFYNRIIILKEPLKYFFFFKKKCSLMAYCIAAHR